MPVINTNNAAEAALRYLNDDSSSGAKSIAELASGSRIVQASDDASALAIATQLQASVTVFQQDIVNITQGRSLVQTADGGLAQISNVLQRMLALATESASGQVTDTQRSQDIDTEYQQLLKEINAIASGTQYGGRSLLGSGGGQSGQTGFSWNSSSVLTGFYEAQVLRNTHFGPNASKVSGDTGTFSDTGQIAKYGNGYKGLPTGTSGTFDASPYEGGNSLGATNFLTGFGAQGAITVSIGIVTSAVLRLERDEVTYQDSGATAAQAAAQLAHDPNGVVAGGVSTTVQSTTSNVITQSAAMTSISLLNMALSEVTAQRAALGAYESRFNFAEGAADTDVQTTQASVSVLADADVAGVKARLSAQDVQIQAAIAAVAQAGQLPTELLKFIQS